MKKTFTHAGNITLTQDAVKMAGSYMLINDDMIMIGCYTLPILKEELKKTRVVNTYTLSEVVYG